MTKMGEKTRKKLELTILLAIMKTSQTRPNTESSNLNIQSSTLKGK